MKIKFKTYLDLLGYDVDFPTISSVSEILWRAIKDGVTELEVSQDEYEVITKWMIYQSMWNWDKKTFMGVEIFISDNTKNK